MQEITKEQYIERINDHERLYLVTTDDHNICLKADIEYGGEIGLRIEMMEFKLDTSLTFWNACNECRCRYTGGICFIEYDYEETKPNVIKQLPENCENCICEKGYRGHPLTEKQKENNLKKSKVRCRIEHIFGFMTGAMHGITIRNIGITRAWFNIGLTNLIYNFCRYEFLKRKSTC